MTDTSGGGHGWRREHPKNRSHSVGMMIQSLLSSIVEDREPRGPSQALELERPPCWYYCVIDGLWYKDEKTAAIHAKVQHGIDGSDGAIIRKRCE